MVIELQKITIFYVGFAKKLLRHRRRNLKEDRRKNHVDIGRCVPRLFNKKYCIEKMNK